MHRARCGARGRSYKPFVAAEVRGRPEEEAERLLREYLGGANERGARLDLTTPLWRSSDGAVSFALAGLQVRGSPVARPCRNTLRASAVLCPIVSDFAQRAAPGLQSSRCLLHVLCHHCG